MFASSSFKCSIEILSGHLYNNISEDIQCQHFRSFALNSIMYSIFLLSVRCTLLLSSGKNLLYCPLLFSSKPRCHGAYMIMIAMENVFMSMYCNVFIQQFLTVKICCMQGCSKGCTPFHGKQQSSYTTCR